MVLMVLENFTHCEFDIAMVSDKICEAIFFQYAYRCTIPVLARFPPNGDRVFLILRFHRLVKQCVFLTKDLLRSK
jgi:hypothetical protein